MPSRKKEALRFHHDYIGTEHLLLGLLIEGSGEAGTKAKAGNALAALGKLGVDAMRLRREVEQLVVASTKPVPRGPIPFTPQAKHVLEFTVEEMRALGHHQIRTEHILLGLVAARDGIAARALTSSAISLERLRDEIRALAPADGSQVAKPPPGETADGGSAEAPGRGTPPTP